MISLIFLFFIDNRLTNGQNSQPSQSLELQVIDIEQKYDTQVIQSLSNYFNRNMFIVDVQIDAEIVEELITVDQPQTVHLHPARTTMPGLPFLPEENLQNREAVKIIQENVQVQRTLRTLNLLNITVNVYADTSFTADQRDFMRLITSIAAKINEPRGDVVNVTPISMPSIGEQPVNAESKPAGLSAVITNIHDLILWLILAFLLGLTVIGARIAGKTHINPNTDSRKLRESREDDWESEEDLIREVPIPKFEKPKPKSRTATEIDELLNNFFNRPHEIALLFEFWMEDDEKNGAKKAAKVIKTVDKHLLRSLVNELSSENYRAISSEIDALPPMSDDQKLETAQKFNSILRSSGADSESASNHGQLDLFPFLSHLTVQQIFNLIENENNRVVALVLDYLPDDRAAKLLDNMPSSSSIDVMVEMTMLHNLSYKEHRQISSALFEKAMDFINTDKHERYAIENVMPILKKLPLENQKEYIDQLIAAGSPIGQAIKGRFITIDQIPSLSDEIIKHALQRIDSKTIVTALSGFNEEIINKIVVNLPKHEQHLIMKELQPTPNQKPSQIRRAKLHLANAIRESASVFNNQPETDSY